MGIIADFLIKKTKEKMDFHKRQASGQAVESLIERSTISRIQVYGIDYWENIDNGIPSGTSVSLTTLDKWVSHRKGRYSSPSDWGVSGPTVQKNIQEGNAWINSQTERLNITPKVLNENKNAINEMVKNYVDTNIRQWQ